MLEKFQEWFEKRHQYAQDWKARNGSKVVGFFCTYAPEEILYAAGALPVRILGSNEPQDVTEPHIFSMFCPFSRDCLAQGLKGRFHYLDGIVEAQCCLHLRQAFWSWKRHIPVNYNYYLPMPHFVQSPRAKPFHTAELAEFKRSVEEWMGKAITSDDLDHAIEVYNTNRRLMKQVYELRRGDDPPLTGVEALYITLSSLCVDKEEHNRELVKLLEVLPDRKLDRETGIRSMIITSEVYNTEFMAMVESLGATFVVDEHCCGTRYFWDEVVPNQDRLGAIAARYVHRVPCPTKDWPQRNRFKQIDKLADDYNVQAVFLAQQKFCDPHENDIPALRKLFQKKNIPTIFLEFDVTVPVGQFRTRVEAFFEMIQGEELF